MSRDNTHFPTFRWVARAAARPASAIPPTVWARWLLTEWGLLRIALYLVLGVCVLNVISTRLLVLITRWPGSPMVYGGPYWSGDPSEYPVLGHVAQWTTLIVGAEPVFPFLIGAGCLVGLAVSSEKPPRVVSASDLITAEVVPPPLPDPPAPPPERHPLDPDPDDPPLEPRWKRT